MRRIGLLGGTSWESSLHYYRLLNEGVRDRLGGKHSADLILRSLEFDEVSALQEADDWGRLGDLYRAEAASLAAGGAGVIGICANTMHLVHDDVVAGAGNDARVVHMVDAVAEAALAAGLTRIGLLGTRYTMASPVLYPQRLAAHGIEVIVPEPADALEVNRVIYDELVSGLVLESSRAALRGVVDRLVHRGAQAFVLGCTELGMVLEPDDPTLPVPALDSMALHVTALLDAALAPQAQLLEEGAA
jgi:aspartate racemase